MQNPQPVREKATQEIFIAKIVIPCLKKERLFRS